MKLSENFYISELKCNCGQCHIPLSVELMAKEHADNLEVIREYVGNKPMTINSWYRCDRWNKAVGGVKSSKHRLGIATDIVIEGMTPDEVYEVIEHLIDIGKIDEGGLGRYNTFTHYDSRCYKARW